VYGTFAFDKTNDLRYRIFRGNRDQHMHVIWHKMALKDLALILQGEGLKHLSEIVSDGSV
jgi:hypothetical protein